MKKFYYPISCITFAMLAMLLGGCKESEIHYSHAKHMERGFKGLQYLPPLCRRPRTEIGPRWQNVFPAI